MRSSVPPDSRAEASRRGRRSRTRRRSPRSSSEVPRDLVQVLVERAPFPALDLREPVQDRAHVESHPECHLHHALLVHGLELADGDGHSVRLDQRPRIPDRHEALAEGRELAERLVRTVAERPEVHPEPLPRPWMQSGIIDVPVQEALLLRLCGFRSPGVREGVVRQPVLTSGHQLLVRQDVPERVELTVLRDADQEVPALLAHLDESLHHRELFREFRERPVDRDDAILEVVGEVDRRRAFDQAAVFVHHVPRLFLAPLFREFEEGPVQLVLARDDLRERRPPDHALHEPPVLPPEGRPVERIPQEADGDQGEPPAREVEEDRIRAVGRDHVLRGFGASERAELRDFLRREWDVPVMFHEQLEFPSHVVDVADAGAPRVRCTLRVIPSDQRATLKRQRGHGTAYKHVEDPCNTTTGSGVRRIGLEVPSAATEDARTPIFALQQRRGRVRSRPSRKEVPTPSQVLLSAMVNLSSGTYGRVRGLCLAPRNPCCDGWPNETGIASMNKSACRSAGGPPVAGDNLSGFWGPLHHSSGIRRTCTCPHDSMEVSLKSVLPEALSKPALRVTD